MKYKFIRDIFNVRYVSFYGLGQHGGTAQTKLLPVNWRVEVDGEIEKLGDEINLLFLDGRGYRHCAFIKKSEKHLSGNEYIIFELRHSEECYMLLKTEVEYPQGLLLKEN